MADRWTSDRPGRYTRGDPEPGHRVVDYYPNRYGREREYESRPDRGGYRHERDDYRRDDYHRDRYDRDSDRDGYRDDYRDDHRTADREGYRSVGRNDYGEIDWDGPGRRSHPGYGRDRDRPSERGGWGRNWMERASDEIASWMGDDEAERRRWQDERQDEYLRRGGRTERETGNRSSWRPYNRYRDEGW